MESESPESEAILARVREGDEEAGRLLVARLHPLVMKIVRAHLPRRELEDDLAQEVFARVFERLDRYEARAGVPFEHWVARLAVRICLDALRAEGRRPEWRCSDLGDSERACFELLADESAASDAAERADAASARVLVDRLLATLSPEDALVLRLLDLDGLSVAEVSRWTGWSAVGVRVRAYRARGRLKRRVEEMKLSLENCR